MSYLYIIRGLPGSGKSTLARHLSSMWDCAYYEADQYFETDEGEYVFDSRYIKIAHKECYENVIRDLNENKHVIVANTFTTYKELSKYIDFALANDHYVIVTHCTGNYDSIHDVPAATVERMRNRWISNEDLASKYNYGILVCT